MMEPTPSALPASGGNLIVQKGLTRFLCSTNPWFCDDITLVVGLCQGRIELPKAARGHATSYNARTDGIVY